MMSQLAEVFTNEDDYTNNIKYSAISFNLLQRLKQKKKKNGKILPLKTTETSWLLKKCRKQKT